jgi:hypothetical protein
MVLGIAARESAGDGAAKEITEARNQLCERVSVAMELGTRTPDLLGAIQRSRQRDLLPEPSSGLLEPRPPVMLADELPTRALLHRALGQRGRRDAQHRR